MLLGSVDFPPELLAARDAGELVVFAGAGVSHPPPSSLPLFKDLADRIGSPSGIQFEKYEQPDGYLGRIKELGVNVHELSASILLNENSRYHDLHRLLYELFPSRESVRLVTTNFDTHFSAAAVDVFGENLETYHAPALPLGSDFKGLVYLHGCAGNDAHRCVLTDADFGRAYLTEAWAARFITSMFSRFVVVFVGYSYNDVVMSYLARALPPTTQRPRYAFSINDEDSIRKWAHLGIQPLFYPRTQRPNEHESITTSIAKLVEVLGLGLLGHSQRIQSILESSPPLEGEDADFLKFSLSKVETARNFFRHAQVSNKYLPEWLRWLEKHRFLQPLFDPNAQLDEATQELSFWVTEQFAATHPQEMLAAIYRHGGRIHRYLCYHIRGLLFRRASEPSTRAVFSLWTALLLAQGSEALTREDFGLLGMKCQIPADKIVAIQLFERLTRPSVILDEQLTFTLDSENVTKSIEFALNLFDDKDHWTDTIWENVLKPNLSTVSNELELVVSSNLATAHALMNLSNIPDYDPLYFQRESVSSSRSIRKLLDVLVDAGRDILIYLVECDSIRAAALIERWFASDASILRRLAVFGFALRRDVTPDQKLKWLLANDLIYRFHAEVKAVVNESYKPASREIRVEVIDAVLQGPHLHHSDEESKMDRIHRFLRRLTSLAPDCEDTAERLKMFLEQNLRFVRSEQSQDRTPVMSTRFLREEGDFDIDKVIAATPEDFMNETLTFPAAAQVEYLLAASRAAERKFDWGVGWIREVITRDLPQTSFWTCIIQGWKAAKLTPEQWHFVLSFSTNIKFAPKDFFSSLVELLVEGAKREDCAIPTEEMALAQLLAERIWREILDETPIEESPSSEDWLSVAINRPGGRIAEFWLQRISRLRKDDGDSWRGIPDDILSPLKLIISGRSGASAHFRTVVASQVHYFFSIDSRFAIDSLIPLFDWQADALRAEQSWHGFLVWGRLQPGLLEALIPHFTDSVRKIRSFPKSLRDRLAESAAVVVFYGIEEPLDCEFFKNIFQHFEENDLLQFCWGIGNLLERAEESVITRVWNGWLKEYWRRRALGLPKSVSAREADVMAGWAVDLKNYFPEAVALLASLRGRFSFKHSRLLMDIDEKGVIKKYPEASADLILLYLNSPDSYLFTDGHTKKIWSDLKGADLSNVKLNQLREAIFRKLNFDPDEL